MHAIRHGEQRAVAGKLGARRQQIDVAGGIGRGPRRIAEPPGAAVVLAPVLGLLLWSALIALLVL